MLYVMFLGEFFVVLNVIAPVCFSGAPFLFPLSVFINSDAESPQARNQTSDMIIT